MLKRIFYIAFYTGIGQLLSIFSLKYVGQHGTPEQLKSIAEADSLILFIINIIGMGLQSAAMRNLALTDDWKEEYHQTQSARMAAGILLTIAAGLFFLNPNYILFIAAPLLAWNGDYALYARGFPVRGAAVAFIRLLIPFSLLIIFADLNNSHLALIYVISLLATYAVTNVYISWFLGTPYFFMPRFANLRLYITSLPLGIVTLSLYFIGLGVILVVPYFYSSAVVATAFVGLKFYMIFKGVLRIIHQAFIKEMIDENVCLKIDQLSIILGITYVGSILIFPDSFITLFFGKKYIGEKEFFTLLGISALIYSLFLSMATKSMLSKKDTEYTRITFGAALVTILSVILLSFYNKALINIAVSLCLGETIWTIGLIKIIGTKKQVKKRAIFILQIIVVLLIPLITKYFFTDKLFPYLVSFILFIAIVSIFHFRRFKTLP